MLNYQPGLTPEQALAIAFQVLSQPRPSAHDCQVAAYQLLPHPELWSTMGSLHRLAGLLYSQHTCAPDLVSRTHGAAFYAVRRELLARKEALHA